MKKIIATSLMAATLAFAGSAEYKYEITPMIGGTVTEGNLNLDSDYAIGGLSVGFNLDDSMFDQVELGFLRSLEDVDYEGVARDTGITRIFTNVIKEYSFYDNASLYGLVGAGIELFDDAAFNNNDGVFGNYGVGYKYTFDNDMALKTDVRHLISAKGGDNNLLYTVGLAIPFGEKAAPVAPKPVPMPIKEEPKPVKMVDGDHDKDGVKDSLDQCPNSPMGAIVDEKGCAVVVDLNINFETNSSIITEQYDQRIKEFAQYLNSNPALKATIEGHTDSRGTAQYNQWLSERRATSTVNMLKANNVDAAKLKLVGFGESQPISSNDTAEGRLENRRIQAIISK